jgi:predicted Fe-Mo cluster-binding NifX family protein
MNMKIAAVSDDSVAISQHYGRARHYIVLTIQNNEISAREKREKMGHAQFGGETHAEGNDPRGHGYDPAAQSRHARMASAIADCQVLLARGMGAGAYDSLRTAGIRPIVTDIAKIDDAVQAYLAGTLVDHVEQLH